MSTNIRPYFLRALILVTLTVGVVACQSPLASLTQRDPAHTASLRVAIDPLAPWLRAQKHGDRTAARNYARADSIKIEVLDEAGEPVMEPVEGLTMDDLVISGVPTDLLLTVRVSVYNHRVSTTVPVVQGRSTPTLFTEGTMGEVVIECIPSEATPLVVGGGASYTLAPGAEGWYSFSATAGETYSFFVGGSWSLSGHDLYPSSYSTWTAVTTGTYWIGVYNDLPLTRSFPVRVQTAPFSLGAGTELAPAPLALNTYQEMSFDSEGGDGADSYYQFTTSGAGDYYLETGMQQFGAELRTGSTSGTIVLAEDVSTEELGELLLEDLAASTTYYLTLTSQDWEQSVYSGILMDPATYAQRRQGLGTKAAPAVLTVGQKAAFGLDASVIRGSVWFEVTTGAATRYSWKVSSSVESSGADLDLYRVDGTRQGGAKLVNAAPCQILVEANTRYLARLVPNELASAQTLTVELQTDTGASASDGSLASPRVLGLDQDLILHCGSTGSGQYASYYSFTTTTQGDYLLELSLTDGWLELYPNSGFTGSLDDQVVNLPQGSGYWFCGLQPTTTYYLIVENYDSQVSAAARLRSPAHTAQLADEQGSPSRPILLSAGTPFTGTLGTAGYNGISFHQIEAGVYDAFEIAVRGVAQGARRPQLALSVSTTTGTTQYSFIWPWTERNVVLYARPGTPLDFVAENEGTIGLDSPLTYTLSVTPLHSPTVVDLLPSSSDTADTILKNSPLWYRVPVSPNATYRVSFSDQDSSSDYTGVVTLTALRQDRRTEYCPPLSSYQSPKVFTVPAGESELYLFATPDASSEGTFAIRVEQVQ